MISKALLSEVLGFNVEWFGLHEENTLEARLLGDEQVFINIHELAHKCKEWAWSLDKQYEINSYKTGGMWNAEIYEGWHGNTAYGDFEKDFSIIDSEPEAIFRATQWILRKINEANS